MEEYRVYFLFHTTFSFSFLKMKPCPNWRCKCLCAGIKWFQMEQCGSTTRVQTTRSRYWSPNSTSWLMDSRCSEWARRTSTLSSGLASDGALSSRGPLYCNGLTGKVGDYTSAESGWIIFPFFGYKYVFVQIKCLFKTILLKAFDITMASCLLCMDIERRCDDH